MINNVAQTDKWPHKTQGCGLGHSDLHVLFVFIFAPLISEYAACLINIKPFVYILKSHLYILLNNSFFKPPFAK